jgi:hypothetical protein
MSDDDLIRRRDAIKALKSADTERCGKCGLPRDSHHVRHPFVTTGFSNPAANIRALPAVQPAPVTVEAAQAVRRFLKHRSVMSGIDRDAILTIGLSVSLTVADLEALVAYVIGPNQAGEAP